MSEDAIRRAERSDRDALVALHEALYVDHRDRVLPEQRVPLVAYRNFRAMLRDDVDGMLRDAQIALLVAVRKGRVVGYISGHVDVDPNRVLATKGVVGDWYVDTRARGSGLGKKLYEALEAVFREMSCDLVESQTWTTNDGARRAHEALGFEEIHVVYRKPLER